MSGYIPIRRSLFDHFLFTEKRAFSRFEAWLDLIQMATFQEENTRLVKGRAVKCRKGQLVASVRFLQDRWSWSIHKVSDFIELLRSQNMLLTDKEEGVNRITLINFEKYNQAGFVKLDGNSKRNSKNSDSKELDGNQGTAKGTRREQSGDSQGTNINKDKEGNKENEGGTPPPDDVQAFEKFKEWISANAPRVEKMKEPFTIVQFLKVRKKYTSVIVRQLLVDMHNWKDLDKRISAYLTLIKWKKLDDKRNPTQQNESLEEYRKKRQAQEERTRRIADS